MLLPVEVSDLHENFTRYFMDSQAALISIYVIIINSIRSPLY